MVAQPRRSTGVRVSQEEERRKKLLLDDGGGNCPQILPDPKDEAALVLLLRLLLSAPGAGGYRALIPVPKCCQSQQTDTQTDRCEDANIRAARCYAESLIPFPVLSITRACSRDGERSTGH